MSTIVCCICGDPCHVAAKPHPTRPNESICLDEFACGRAYIAKRLTRA